LIKVLKPEIVKGKIVLDLGCGTGLVGIVRLEFQQSNRLL